MSRNKNLCIMLNKSSFKISPYNNVDLGLNKSYSPVYPIDEFHNFSVRNPTFTYNNIKFLKNTGNMDAQL